MTNTMNKAEAYLKKRLPDIKNPYSVAMVSYAMANHGTLDKELLLKFSTGQFKNILVRIDNSLPFKMVLSFTPNVHDCVTVWLCDCVTVWLCDCLTVWLCDCVTVWLCLSDAADRESIMRGRGFTSILNTWSGWNHQVVWDTWFKPLHWIC